VDITNRYWKQIGRDKYSELEITKESDFTKRKTRPGARSGGAASSPFATSSSAGVAKAPPKVLTTSERAALRRARERAKTNAKTNAAIKASAQRRRVDGGGVAAVVRSLKLDGPEHFRKLKAVNEKPNTFGGEKKRAAEQQAILRELAFYKPTEQDLKGAGKLVALLEMMAERKDKAQVHKLAAARVAEWRTAARKHTWENCTSPFASGVANIHEPSRCRCSPPSLASVAFPF
jgi:hypothetical protein